MATTYFGFDQLSGSDAAGYVSINALLTDIDSILNTRFGGVINTTNYSALTAGDAGKIIKWSGTAFTTALIDNTNVSASAAIAYSKLNLTGSIVNADLAGSINPSKITGTAVTAADTGTVTSTMIADGTIVNADINASAGIAKTKISGTAITAADTGTVTASILASSLDLSAKTVTLPNGIMIDGAVVTPATDDSAKVATTAFVQDALTNAATGGVQVTTSGIAQDAITYDKLNDDAKVYAPVSITSTPTTLTIGQHDSTKNTTIPLVKVDNSTSNYVINIPTGGVTGSTISIFQTGSGTVTVQPVSSSVTINGSTSNTYVLGAAYSMVTLVCYASNTWIITGDYI